MDNDKVRTKEMVDQEYSDHAVQIGHKTRIISLIEDEIESHLEKMKSLHSEALEMKDQVADEL